MALTSLMKCDSSHTVTLSMQTTVGDNGQNQGCNSIDIWNLRLELGRKLRQGVNDAFRKMPDGSMVKAVLKMSIELPPRSAGI